MTQITQIQLRRGSASAWTLANPILADGEIGIESDTSRIKIGDSATAWVDLQYALGSATAFAGLTDATTANIPAINVPTGAAIAAKYTLPGGGMPRTDMDSAVQASLTLAGTAAQASAIGAANGIAALDSGGKVPTSQLPASVVGSLNYQGAWNASTNSPTLVSSTGTKGFYYTVGTAGSTTLDGISQWNVGDHAAYNGAAWEKIDGVANQVLSVAGRTGAVTIASTDLTDISALNATIASKVPGASVGAANGVASLDSGSRLPAGQLPTSGLVVSVAGRSGTVTIASSDLTDISTLNATIAAKVPLASVGVANGVAGLDGGGKVPTSQLPASVVGSLSYQGTWDASTNTPHLASGVGTSGFYYKVSVAGSTMLDGINVWNIGDTPVYSGTAWEKLDGLSNDVLSVAGKTGVVVLVKADVGLANVDNTSDVNKPVSTAQATALTGKVATSSVGAANGVASLDSGGKVPLGQIPSSVSSPAWGVIVGTLSAQTDLSTALAAKYVKPGLGIPSTDMTSAVTTSLGKADSAYQKPSPGIPSTDSTAAVQTSLGKADSAYQKPGPGIPSTDTTSAVQTSLGKADSAYQKPGPGIPSTDTTAAVQASLALANSSYQKPGPGIPVTDLTASLQAAISTVPDSIAATFLVAAGRQMLVLSRLQINADLSIDGRVGII